MKYKLILLKDGRNILVSDENIKDGELMYRYDTGIIQATPNFFWDFQERYMKILAGIESLPTITYSDKVKQILRDKYGWVDVEEFCKQQVYKIYQKYIPKDFLEDYVTLFELGFKAHQSITNKIFSLEDMVKIYKEGYTDCLHNRGEYKTDYLINKLQQPIQLDIEVEIEEVGGDNLENSNKKQIYYNRPKITNNSILITKILE